MDKIRKYLEILDYKEFGFNKIQKNQILNYSLFRAQNFYKKLNKTKIVFKKKFLNEIKEVMFGYGDSCVPDKNVVRFIENSIIKFVSLIVAKVNFISFLRVARRPMFEDILFMIRKDPQKTKRIVYLVKMKEIIEKLVKQTKNSNQIPKEIISKCKKQR